MKIQTKQLSDIKPYWRNARKNDKTVEGLKQSIKSYGYTQPINIDENGVILIETRVKPFIRLTKSRKQHKVKVQGSAPILRNRVKNPFLS